jgi:hypothetical protein
MFANHIRTTGYMLRALLAELKQDSSVFYHYLPAFGLPGRQPASPKKIDCSI